MSFVDIQTPKTKDMGAQVGGAGSMFLHLPSKCCEMGECTYTSVGTAMAIRVSPWLWSRLATAHARAGRLHGLMAFTFLRRMPHAAIMIYMQLLRASSPCVLQRMEPDRLRRGVNEVASFNGGRLRGNWRGINWDVISSNYSQFTSNRTSRI